MKKGSVKKSAHCEILGKTFETANYGVFKVIEYRNYNNVVVEFVDTKTIVNTSVYRIKKCDVKDYNLPKIYGKGYVGFQQTRCCVKQTHNLYKTWSGMLQRCYDTVFKNRHSSYLNTKVEHHFHSFYNFLLWAKKQKGYDKGWHLDKDILGDNKNIYSAETCCFVPREINNLCLSSKKTRGCLPLGVTKKGSKFRARLSIFGKELQVGVYNTPEEAFYAYKEAKENYIKDVANKWKDQIDHRVYEALINYEVEITD